MASVTSRLLPVVFFLQVVSAGILEQAFDTVQKSLFTLPQTLLSNQGGGVADRNEENISNDDPTSMHFKNQDFKIVLGKAGLNTLDSILDKVFNFTTELHERNEKYNLLSKSGLNSLVINSPKDEIEPASTSSKPPYFNRTSPHAFINVLNSRINSENLSSALDGSQNINKSSKPRVNFYDRELSASEANISPLQDYQQPLKRRRPILTDKDAPVYYDKFEGVFKANIFNDNVPEYARNNYLPQPTANDEPAGLYDKYPNPTPPSNFYSADSVASDHFNSLRDPQSVKFNSVQSPILNNFNSFGISDNLNLVSSTAALSSAVPVTFNNPNSSEIAVNLDFVAPTVSAGLNASEPLIAHNLNFAGPIIANNLNSAKPSTVEISNSTEPIILSNSQSVSRPAASNNLNPGVVTVPDTGLQLPLLDSVDEDYDVHQIVNGENDMISEDIVRNETNEEVFEVIPGSKVFSDGRPRIFTEDELAIITRNG